MSKSSIDKQIFFKETQFELKIVRDHIQSQKNKNDQISTCSILNDLP